jgi:voltage-gated potassium channel
MVRTPGPPTKPDTIRHRWRFGVVLVASLLLAVAQPLMSGLFDDEGCFDIFFSLLIAAVLLLVFKEKEHRRIAFSLGLAAFLGIWVGYGVGGPSGRVLLVGAYSLAACIFAFALYGILRAILAKQASGDAIFGAMCGYLLLGIIWSLMYFALEIAAPRSFEMQASGDADVVPARLDRGALSYYSFITLATVGYGDVTPTTPFARTLAWIEAVTGQFYLAILVAGLVGFKVAQAMNEPTDKEEHDE